MDERDIPRVLRWHALFRKASDATGREILERLGAGVLRASAMPRDGRSRRRFWPVMDRRAIVVLLGAYAASAIAFAWLPGPAQRVPVFGRLLIAFTLPTAALAVYVMLRGLSVRSPDHIASAPAQRASEAVPFRIVMFLVALHGLVLASLLGSDAIHSWARPGVITLLVVAFAAIGPLLRRRGALMRSPRGVAEPGDRSRHDLHDDARRQGFKIVR
jgi:hypothetical protein